MAIIAILQSATFAQTSAWKAALQAGGHTVLDYTNGIPTGAVFDVAAFFGGTGTANTAAAHALLAVGKSVLTAANTTQSLPFVSAWGEDLGGLCAGAIMGPVGSSPLTAGWGAFALQTSQLAWATNLSSTVQVLGTYQGPYCGVGQDPRGAPLYMLQEYGASQFWLDLQYSGAVPAALLTDAAAYIATRYAGGGACSPTVPCPAGQVCTNGICGPCSATSPCTPPQVCVNGVCITPGSGNCAAGEVSIFGLCLPWWLLAALGIGTVLLLSGGNRDHKSQPRHRRRLRHARPRIVTRTVHVRHRETPSEASAVLHRRAEQLGRA